MNSPCVKICRLEHGTCVGCKRTVQEIAQWSKMTPQEQEEVLARIKNASIA